MCGAFLFSGYGFFTEACVLNIDKTMMDGYASAPRNQSMTGSSTSSWAKT